MGYSTYMNSHSMIVRADARAMGLVTDHNVRVAPRWQASSAAQRAQVGVGTSDCVSYKLDEHGNKIEAHIFRAKRERTSSRRRNVSNEAQATRLRLLQAAGIIGNVGN